MSTFSEVIYLKKTFITNKLGNPVTPPPPKLLRDSKSENIYLSKKVVELGKIIKANHPEATKLEGQLEIKLKENLDLETLNKNHANKICELKT